MLLLLAGSAMDALTALSTSAHSSKDYLQAEVLCWPLETGIGAGTLIGLHLCGQRKERQDQGCVRIVSGEHPAFLLSSLF